MNTVNKAEILKTLVVIGAECIGSCTPNYYTMTTTNDPNPLVSSK